MARTDIDIAIKAKLGITDETARRCLALLEMYLDDNPGISIICERIPYVDEYRHSLFFKKEWEAETDEKPTGR